jgi:MFS family permease
VRSAAYRYYLLALLLAILASDNVESVSLGLVLQDIKRDFILTDSQLGVLSGIAWALFYAVAGIPIARWADRGNRVTIISVTAGAWSLMVALCGLATSFVQLLLIRVGVGIGEAGCVPPAHSLIADEFNRSERPRAVAIYMQGNSLGILLGYFVAGWLNQWFGWRKMFMILGLPGLLLAAMAWLTLKEPRRDRFEQPPLGPEHGAGQAKSSLISVCLSLWANRTFRHLLYAFSVANFFSAGLVQWQPAFFMRSYGLSSGELGTWFAAIYGIGGMLGMHLGGEWASARAASNERLQLRAMSVGYALYGVLSVATYLVHDIRVAFALMSLSTIVSSATTGPLFATIQTLIPARQRATSIALVYLVANLIGTGFGPLGAGILSDAFRGRLGEESLRWALVSLSPGLCWVTWHLLKASQTVERDVAAASE